MIPTLGSMVRSALPGGQPTMDGIMRTRAGASFAAVLARGTAQLSGWLLACGDHAGRGDDPWASAEWGLKLSRPVADGGMMCVAVGRRRPPNACVDLVRRSVAADAASLRHLCVDSPGSISIALAHAPVRHLFGLGTQGFCV